MIYGLLYILWVTSGMGAAAYASFSTKKLPETAFWEYQMLKRGFDDRIMRFMCMSFTAILVGPLLWIHVISEHHKLLKLLLKQKKVEVKKDAELAEQLVDKALDLREDTTG